MTEDIDPSWRAALDPALELAATRALLAGLAAEERAAKAILPPAGQRLAAFRLTPLDAVKVVILGQDPYPTPGHAHGLAFSVQPGVKVPRSLANIRREAADDLGLAGPADGHLERWARQGVLLLNTCLTVEAGKAGSHVGRGWEAVTEAALQAVADAPRPSVFIAWGKPAQQRLARIPALAGASRHLVIASPHPSPLSARRGFFGSRPFSRANAFLSANGRGPIDW